MIDYDMSCMWLTICISFDPAFPAAIWITPILWELSWVRNALPAKHIATLTWFLRESCGAFITKCMLILIIACIPGYHVLDPSSSMHFVGFFCGYQAFWMHFLVKFLQDLHGNTIRQRSLRPKPRLSMCKWHAFWEVRNFLRSLHFSP